MSAFDDLLPEELEGPNRDFIASLKHFYQQPAPLEQEVTLSLDEQKAILAEVRASLLSTRSMGEQHPPRMLFINEELPQPPVHAPLKRRVAPGVRLFNTFAAVLAVVMLIAASLVLFTNLRNVTSSTKPHPNTGLASNADPACLPAGTIKGIGLDYLCTQHLYQDLNLTKGDEQYQVTLTKGYADQGQVLIWYQVARKINGQYQLMKPTTVALASEFGLYQPDGSSLAGGPSQPVSHSGIVGLSIPVNASATNRVIPPVVQVRMQLTDVTLLSPTLENVALTLGFQFNLNVHGNWHSVSLQKTQVANGHSLTLISVGYSLSMVSALFQSSEPSFSSTYHAPIRPYGLPLITSFKVGDSNCILDPQSRFYQGASENSPSPYMGAEVSLPEKRFGQIVNCSLPGVNIPPQSEVTLSISMYSTASSLKPSAVWTFKFPLP